MAQHLFIFGFESPHEFRINSTQNTDFESSRAILIRADTEEAALAWGRTIAEQYVNWLFSRDQTKGYSWDAAVYSHWLEPDRLEKARSLGVPSIEAGEIPNFEELDSNG